MTDEERLELEQIKQSVEEDNDSYPIRTRPVTGFWEPQRVRAGVEWERRLQWALRRF